MGTSETPPHGISDDEPRLDVVVRKLIDERVEKERAYLNFAQDQARADREYFKHLFDRAIWFLGFIVLIAGFFGFRSFEQMEN